MKLSRTQHRVLKAIDAGCTRPVQAEMLIGKKHVYSAFYDLRNMGVIEQHGKDWVIVDHNWRTYETLTKKRYAQPKKQTANKEFNASLEEQLDPTLHKLIEVMCWTINEADARGIARSDIDVARVMEACRSMVVPEFRRE